MNKELEDIISGLLVETVVTFVTGNGSFYPTSFKVEGKTIHVINESDAAILFDSLVSTLIDIKQRINVCIDIETNGLDAYKNDILLLSLNIGEKIIFVYDMTSINEEKLKNNLRILNPVAYWFGHGIKFEQNFIKVKFDFYLETVFDTMIADQRLYQNMGFKADLGTLCNKYLKISNDYLDTDKYQISFVGLTKSKSLRFSNEQIYYSAMDVYYPFQIAKLQIPLVENFHMERLLYQIEFPLIEVLSSMELYGSRLNTDLLRKIVSENETKLVKVNEELDNELKTLIKYKEEKENLKPHIPQLSKNRNTKVIQTTLLFDETFSDVQVNVAGYLNYSSTPQIVKVFAELNEKLPMKKGNAQVPITDANNNVEQSGFTTDEKTLKEFLIENPNIITKGFFDLLFQYRETVTELNKYNESFISTINPTTGFVHTKFKQCDNDNSRLGSGGGKKEPDKFNSQNIPRKEALRNMFLANKNEYLTLTIDLAGAEVTIMASKAKDQKIFDLSMKGDIHSYMATRGWRAIFKARGDLDKAANFIVSKTENKHLRQIGKNLTFGAVYGAGAQKAGKTINVSKEEGAVYIQAIKSEIPKTIRMIRNNIEFAMRNGYILINNLNNSRCWFPEIIANISRGVSFDEYNENSSLRAKVSGQAANIPISGTQADMLKEAMVRLYYYFKLNNIDAHLKFSVHDELVIDFHKDLIDSFPENIKNLIIDTCNQYLDTIQMGAEYHIAPYWVKDPPKTK